MNRVRLELTVGLFVLVGLACGAWLSLRLGSVSLPGRRGYSVSASFGSVEGLSEGTSVMIAGVRVGRIERIGLKDDRALVRLRIDRQVVLHDDAIASVRSRGLVGEKFVAISPGASPRTIPPGGLILDTEDAVNVEQLIAQFIHGRIQ
jgi:phospholipid/cholesterol/gamma-HCH transport system substrate-binding protein